MSQAIEAKRKRVHMTPRLVYPIFAILISCLLLSIFTLIYVIRSNNNRIAEAKQAATQAQTAAARTDAALHHLCPLFLTLDSAYQAAKPVTDLGKLVAQEMHQVVIQLACAASKPR